MFVCRRAGIIFVQRGPFSLPADYADAEISHGRPSQTAGFVATAGRHAGRQISILGNAALMPEMDPTIQFRIHIQIGGRCMSGGCYV